MLGQVRPGYIRFILIIPG